MKNEEHRRYKRSSWTHLRSTRALVIVSSPLIYGCVRPFLMVDLTVMIYQAVCFPIYGIPKVRRRDFLVFDRGSLQYLNTIERVGCVYCSYANGLLAMITEIGARTERYFCDQARAAPGESALAVRGISAVRQCARVPGAIGCGGARAGAVEEVTGHD